MPRILVLVAHPTLETSVVNRSLTDTIGNMRDVTICDLYEHYPDFEIDVEREQENLRNHDIIVLQHPFYWYSAPALIKEWQDLVLEHGFAYGSAGTALVGKALMNVISTGGGKAAYSAAGYNHFTIRQFLVPFEQTARLCGMNYLAPFIVHQGRALAATERQVLAKSYRGLLEKLRDGQIDSAQLTEWDDANTLLSSFGQETPPNSRSVT